MGEVGRARLEGGIGEPGEPGEPGEREERDGEREEERSDLDGIATEGVLGKAWRRAPSEGPREALPASEPASKRVEVYVW